MASKKSAKKSVKSAAKKSTKKLAKKKAAPKKAAKKSAKKYAPKKKLAKKRAPAGYKKRRASGLYVPDNGDFDDSKDGPVVPMSKLQKGIQEAANELKNIADSISDKMAGYSTKEIAIEASFSADGKFLGVGVGGATTVKITVVPEDDDDFEYEYDVEG